MLIRKFPLVGYVITEQRITFATLKSQNVISLFQCKTVSSPLCVLKDQCFERIPIYYQNKVQFVDQVSRKTFPRSIEAPCKSDNFDQQISLDADGDNTYRLTPYPIKSHNTVKIFTTDEVDSHFTHAEFTAQQLGFYSQHDWNKSVDKMRFNQLVDASAEKFELARAVNFADLAKQAQLQAQFSRLRTEYNDCFNKLFINGKEFTLRRLDWQDLINGSYLKESLIGTFGYPWYLIKEIAIIWTVFNLLQFIIGLFCNVLNTYNLKTLLGPNITLPKIITSGFFGIFSQTIVHVLQVDSTNYKSPSPKKRRRHSVESGTPHSHHELNQLHKKLENFYKKFSSPARNISIKHTSTLPVSIYQCYESPVVQSRQKPDFQSLQLHTFQPNQRKRSHTVSISQDSFEEDPNYQEIDLLQELILNLPSTRV